MIPSSDIAKRVAAIMHRHLSTHWSKREISKFRELAKQHAFVSLPTVERYYAANWPPRHGKNSLRTDLYTVLYNWSGETDRANIWAERNPVKTVRKVIQMPLQQQEDPYVAPTDPESLALIAKFNITRQLRKKEQMA